MSDQTINSSVQTKIVEETYYVKLEIGGRVDSFSVDDLRYSFDQVIKKGKKNILLTMKDLNYIDSKGVGAFLSFAKWVNKINGKIKIVDMPSNIKGVFNLLSLDKMFPIYESESEAIESF